MDDDGASVQAAGTLHYTLGGALTERPGGRRCPRPTRGVS